MSNTSELGACGYNKSADGCFEANLVPDIHLPTVTCISKLKYNKSCGIQHSFETRYPGIPLDRNHVSISAICENSSACRGSHLQKVELEGERGNPDFAPAIDAGAWLWQID